MPNRNTPANKNVNQPNRKRRRVRKYGRASASVGVDLAVTSRNT